jgi:hypothetical protein
LINRWDAESNIIFCKNWLRLEKYHFKIIAIATVLADEKRAYRGTIKDICQNLSISNSATNRANIKKSIDFLHDNKYINVIKDKNIYTISLAAVVEKSKNIIKIKKAWYELIRDNHGEVAWESLLKVFLIVYDLSLGKITTYNDIAESVNLSKSTVSRCVKVLDKINFIDFSFRRKTIKEKNPDDTYITKGQTYDKVLLFE